MRHVINIFLLIVLFFPVKCFAQTDLDRMAYGQTYQELRKLEIIKEQEDIKYKEYLRERNREEHKEDILFDLDILRKKEELRLERNRDAYQIGRWKRDLQLDDVMVSRQRILNDKLSAYHSDYSQKEPTYRNGP